MVSITESVIRDQFHYLAAALRQPLPRVTGRVLVFTGCGTSYYLAQILACASNLAGQPALAVPGAEWVQTPGAYLTGLQGCTVIGLSRSGTTTETVQALRAARKRGLPTVALSSENGATILTKADQPIYLPTDPREGIVMTVSANLMLLAGLRLCGVRLSAADLEAAADVLSALDRGAGAVLTGRSHFVYLGSGPLYGLACEGALNLLEMSLSFAHAFHPMEYRHGPISLIDGGSLVAVLYSPQAAAGEASVARDVQAKGARVIGFGGPGDLSIAAPMKGAAAALVMLPALQLLGEMIALQKNLNTETPRHLTKVVVLGEG